MLLGKKKKKRQTLSRIHCSFFDRISLINLFQSTIQTALHRICLSIVIINCATQIEFIITRKNEHRIHNVSLPLLRNHRHFVSYS